MKNKKLFNRKQERQITSREEETKSAKKSNKATASSALEPPQSTFIALDQRFEERLIEILTEMSLELLVNATWQLTKNDSNAIICDDD